MRSLCSRPRTLPRPPSPAPARTVTLEGWVHRRRELAKVTFLVVRDRSGLAQVVLPAGTAVPPEETTVRVTGTATANAQAPGGVEVTDAVVEALTEPAETPPAELWRPDARRRAADAARPRAGRCGGTRPSGRRGSWRPPRCAASAPRLDALGFTEITTPKFVESATESGANVFAVDYFGRPAYLAQSPQFYKQQLVGVFERVYEVGPVFRAEPHDTVRHLAEYVSLDVELGFIERPPRRARGAARGARRHGRRGSASTPPPRSSAPARGCPWCPTRSRSSTSPRRSRWSARPADEPDLAPEHERALGAWALAEHGQRLPRRRGLPDGASGRSTRTRSPSDPQWSNSFDLLFRGLELVTGGQRLHRPGGLRRGDPGARRGPGRLRGVPPGVPARHAAARRLRDRARALGGPARRGDQHPRGHAVPPRPAPPDALGAPRRPCRCRGRPA